MERMDKIKELLVTSSFFAIGFLIGRIYKKEITILIDNLLK